MKASEAIDILAQLDPDHEVTLTLNRYTSRVFPSNPSWATTQPSWISKPPSPKFGNQYEITCKQVH